MNKQNKNTFRAIHALLSARRGWSESSTCRRFRSRETQQAASTHSVESLSARSTTVCFFTRRDLQTSDAFAFRMPHARREPSFLLISTSSRVVVVPDSTASAGRKTHVVETSAGAQSRSLEITGMRGIFVCGPRLRRRDESRSCDLVGRQ